MTTTKIVLLVLGLVVLVPVTVITVGTVGIGVASGITVQKQDVKNQEAETSKTSTERQIAEDKLRKLQVEYEAALRKEKELTEDLSSAKAKHP